MQLSNLGPCNEDWLTRLKNTRVIHLCKDAIAKETEMIENSELIAYGYTHSQREGSMANPIFYDSYLRDASSYGRGHSILDYIIICDSNRLVSIPVNDFSPSLLRWLGETVVDTEVKACNGRQITFIKVNEKDKMKFIIILGLSGNLPSMSEQQWYAVTIMGETCVQTCLELSKLSLAHAKKHFSSSLLKDISCDDINAYFVKNIKLLGMLIGYKTITELSDIETNMHVLKAMIEDISQQQIDNDKVKRMMVFMALERINKILKDMILRSYQRNNIDSVVGLIFDDVTYIHHLLKKYTETEIEEKVKRYVKKVAYLDELPTAVFLGGSAMCLFSRFLVKISGDDQPCLCYVDRMTYYEIVLLLGLKTKLGEMINDREDAFCLNISDSSCIVDYNERIVLDVLITSFVNNPSISKTGVSHNKPYDIIDQQLELRKTSGIHKPLYVLIDTTAGPMLGNKSLPQLLSRYQSGIHNGMVIVVVIHSLNKTFHMGFDRTPAGLGACFFSKKHHPNFAEYTPARCLNGFKPYDKKITSIVYLMDTFSNYISEYYNHLIRTSHYVHHAVFQHDLYRESRCISVDNPKCMCLGNEEYEHIWIFLVIRIKHQNNEVSKSLFDMTCLLLRLSGIEYRDGYGFCKTTYVYLSKSNPRIIRVSLGTELIEVMKAKFEFIFHYLLKLNSIIMGSDKDISRRLSGIKHTLLYEQGKQRECQEDKYAVCGF